MAPPNTDKLQSLINHIFLPPKLPQDAEYDDENVDLALLDTTLRALRSLQALLPLGTIDNAVALISSLRAVNSLPGANIDANRLKETLATLPVGQTLATKISAQNAAVLITRSAETLIFEEFELSPLNQGVCGTKGRLRRDFPGLAVTLSADLLNQSDFTENVATTLSTMCRQQVPGMQPTSKKAGSKHDEERDTTSPDIVSELFFGFLRGLELPTTTTVSSISKNMREEVLWRDAKAPWRRLPMWTLIRVALQLVLSRSSDGNPQVYKETMLYIMSHVLHSARDSSSDMLFVMTAKIQRRIQKLSALEQKFPICVMASVRKVLQETSETLATRWSKIQQRDARDMQLPFLASLDFEKDTLLSLPALDKHIEAIVSRQRVSESDCFTPSSELLKHRPDSLPTLPGSNSTDRYYATANLNQFELWVAQYIDQWVAMKAQKDACQSLSGLMMRYHALASAHYSGNPEMQSVMILTIYEIWVACDKVAVRTDPLLARFEPGIPAAVLQNLLLPSINQMKRLSRVETYLEDRSSRSTNPTNRLFDMGLHGFANQFFAQSNTHRELKAKIEVDANVERQRKHAEFDNTIADYRRLDALAGNANHQYTTRVIDNWCNPPETEQVHLQSSCPKCGHERARDALTITVHEWPLPSDVSHAQAVVFELQVPSWFATWRDLRSFFLQNVLKGWREPLYPNTAYYLSTNDPHLTHKHFRGLAGQRISLLSQVKPCLNSHYKDKSIPTLNRSDICVANGLRYGYYDATSCTDMGPLAFPDTVALSCTYTPRTAIQSFVFRPASAPDGPGPNTAIASQSACPIDMALEEYKELATIPLGHHIQLANILLQLSMPGVDFKKHDTTLVLLQCLHQTGPKAPHVLREAHEFFSSPESTTSLLINLTIALQRVQKNWESAQAVRTFIAIAVRALSVTSSATVRDAALVFLKRARHVALGWVLGLREKAFTAKDHDHRTAFILKSVEIALICVSTFDVDSHYVPGILSQDASILFQSSIVIQEGEHVQAGSQNQCLAVLDVNAKRLLHRIHQLLKQNCLHAHLDDAIHKSWSSYVPGATGWKTVSESGDHWLITTTAGAGDSGGLRVHYNLLSGELLVNGLPLDQPPKLYREDPLYARLFGRAIVEVMPCSYPGFPFSTKRTFGDGQKVQLGITSGYFTVKATRDSNAVETIPHYLIQGLPTHFQLDYVHWLDASTNTVQFRPAGDPWNPSSPAMWTLSKHGKRWQLAKDGCHVAGVESSTSRRVCHILRPLASDPATIHQVVHAERHATMLRIDIPSIRVGFSITQGTSAMMSREEGSMCVDSDQSLGALIGLESKLVLRPARCLSPQTSNRKVLIPESMNVEHSQIDGHANVGVSKTSLISTVHILEVDALLGRLVAKGNDVGCALYVAYLHAITSFCLRDPLTQMTGTEQALTMLRGAGVHSFDRLTQAQVDTLHKIGRLSPRRSFYPRDKRVMQTVGWDNQLSFLSQHGHFMPVVQALLEKAEATKVFYPDDKTQLRLASLGCMDQQYLHERDNIRAATFRVSSHGAEDHNSESDSAYTSRDRELLSKRATKAATMSRFMSRDGNDLSESPLGSAELWEQCSDVNLMHGPNLPVETSLMKYGAHMLEEAYDIVMMRLPALYRWLSSVQDRPFSVALWFSTIAFTSQVDDRVLELIGILFKSKSSFAHLRAPDVKSFLPKAGKSCLPNVVRQLVASNCKPFPESSVVRQPNEKSGSWNRRRGDAMRAWQQNCDRVAGEFSVALTQQWPCEEPYVPEVARQTTHIKVSGVMELIEDKFQSWHDNSLLSEYLEKVAQIVANLRVRKVQAQDSRSSISVLTTTLSAPGHVSVQDLFLRQPPSLPTKLEGFEFVQTRPHPSSLEEPRLLQLTKALEKSLATSKFGKKYLDGLVESLQAMRARGDLGTPPNVAYTDILAYHGRCNDQFQAVHHILMTSLVPTTDNASWSCMPRVSATFLLRQLAHDRWNMLNEEWKTCIVEYGLALTDLQRAKRLLKLMQAETPSMEDVAVELRNPGHRNWKPMLHPESLLIEVEGNIMIRDVQEQIAAQMRDPPNGENAVMQLNMGEGKSSVIVPITAAALAAQSSRPNGNTEQRLVRVVVAKPQSKQMAQMLISKLGGLLNRRVYYLPFSRSLKLDSADIATICNMIMDCKNNGGVLLVQPEHLLSFQLMGLESWVNGHEDVGRQLLSTQTRRLLDSARDIVDESDENFSVRFELIYTMGTQSTVELSPDRWLVPQQLLDIIRRLAPSISEELPGSLECHIDAVMGSFPRIRILRSDAEQLLLQRLAEDVCSNGLYGLQVSRQPEATRRAIYVYITKLELSVTEINAVESSTFWTEATKSPLLLLRGLIAGGVIAFTFGSKRWRVNYGLTISPRTPPTKLAVPYRAKDSPSPRSEFSHPDVVIILTLLSYYYEGLADDDLFIAMGHVVESDQSDVEYQAWVKDANALPATFQNLQGINMKDGPQCVEEVFPALRLAKSAIDYFLAHIVFPKEMKEFPDKLSASGWDLGKSKKRSGGAVTGFSGTNDSRCLLPIDVHHLDLDEQKHTNALVLEHILQPANGVVLMLSGDDKQASDAERLLATVMSLDPPVQVILDVGAQILELNNLQVARTWLSKHDETKEAAVFIDDADDLCVLDRGGTVELLRMSSFSNRLGSCLIFLDEAHTRGIDLQLPRDYRAVVTLGAELTKDRLVQACMRMRKLGQGQTVVFCISPEIQAKILTGKAIRSHSRRRQSSEITVADVLQWSISETYKDIRRSMPLWAVQGERFVLHEDLWNRSEAQMNQARAEEFQEKEAQSLDERYRPRTTQSQPHHLANSGNARLRQVSDRCEEFDDLQFNASTLQEEQERELSPEIESERQVQRAPDAEPATHILHADVRRFALSGVYLLSSTAYMPAFEALRDSSAAKHFPIAQLSNSKLLVTKDFAETIKRIGRGSYVSDPFQRAVQWILSSRAFGNNSIDRMLIISPFEANELYSKMQTATATTLHMYKPRVNSSYPSLDHLQFHTVPAQNCPSVPRALAIQLDLFAGQLFISSYEDYLEICRFLGLSTKAVTQAMTQQGWQQDAVGFILRDDQGQVGGPSGLEKSPVNFFKILMSTIRKNGESIGKTDMGALLEGKLFTETDF